MKKNAIKLSTMSDHSITIYNELVSIDPKYLNKRILQHIQRKLIETKVGKCTKYHGFIKSIDIKKVSPAPISMADSSTRFSVVYTIYSLLPSPNKVYSSKSVVIINHETICGAIITVDDSCEDHPFQIFLVNGFYKDKQYQFKDCKCSIPSSTNSSSVEFVLTNIVVDTVEYYETQFRVTGKHIHNYQKNLKNQLFENEDKIDKINNE
jgi:DNA-directed RNA polymerase subunit E'/Rpb7